jgi:adenine-specific DNA-methyltransferase
LENVEEVYSQQVYEGRFWFGKDGRGVPRRKTYLSEREGKNVWTWWSNKEVGHTQEATQELKALFSSKTVFDFPKPSRLIRTILNIATKQDSIILDSFSDSGTTAHAVLNLNKADGGNRRFILVEMEDYAETITAERVRRVIDGYADVEGTGGGFSYYELGEALLLPDGNLNEAVGADKIREYVWYTETQRHMTELSSQAHQYLLGDDNGVAYYFYYDKERTTTLDALFLETITHQAERMVIYADRCALSPADLRRFNITYKKIPRDIAKL